MNHDIRANLDDLINGLLTGRLLEVFDKYYHDDVVMSENAEQDPNRVGKAANRGYEAYFASNATWHDAKVGAIAVDGNTSMYEMFCDFTINGTRMTHWQACIQEWKDGKIIRETFYYKP